MDPLLFLMFQTEFERWRIACRTNNSLNDSLSLLGSVLESVPQLNSSDTPLRRLLRGLQCASKLPNDIYFKELELLATLGLKTILEGLVSVKFDKTNTASEELQDRVEDIHVIARLSYRYWALHDSQDQVLQRGRKAAQKDIATAGGKGKRDSLVPLKKQVEALAVDADRKLTHL